MTSVFYVEEVNAIILVGNEGELEMSREDQLHLDLIWEEAQAAQVSATTISNWILIGEL